MKRPAAILGTFVFFLIAPVTVALWIPFWLTGWRTRPGFAGIEAVRWLGVALAAIGLGIVLECFWRFANRGRGTPAPIAPTDHLVVSGLYRYVRNPMYVGVLAAILGQALWLSSGRLVAYAAFVWLLTALFVLLYEEPTLRRRFGDEYARYREHVPAWWPRLKPWNPGTVYSPPPNFDRTEARR